MMSNEYASAQVFGADASDEYLVILGRITVILNHGHNLIEGCFKI
ncbi:MAG TPA: hypothetical protein PLU88_04630 [Armatimonadota bacterium]|nr:hypothetical protein [Armatimonadota bacterium]